MEWLPRVEKPGRYTGGELYMENKTPEGKTRFCLCFPDTYEVGMSHLGSRILYHVLNDREDTFCERCYTPWPDAEKELLTAKQPLFSLETRTPLDQFHILGFSLLYELTYANVLTMLSLSGIPLLREARNPSHPLIIAGGPCCCNPEPMADFFDVFLIGDGEEAIETLVDCYRAHPKKADFLREISRYEGVYVPSYYRVQYKEDGRVAAVLPQEDAPVPVKRTILSNLDAAPFPVKPLVPTTQIIHDRGCVELFRGCTRGCRFCQAGYLYRPMRLREKDTVCRQAKEIIRNTGYDELSLTSLSSGDYPYLSATIGELAPAFSEKRVSLALPSLRIDSFSEEYAQGTGSVRRGSLTFAPEAGTQRLRDVINKGVTQENLLDSVKGAYLAGYSSIKLYFMLGLPTETDEDLLGIHVLAKQVVDLFFSLTPKQRPKKTVQVGVSVSSFVPKPHTPFGWMAQDSPQEIARKQDLLKNAFRREKHCKLSTHDPRASLLEAAFSRGDRRLGRVILRAHALGARLDGWSEWMQFDLWEKAFQLEGLTMAFYANREREFSEYLPYEHIDIGVSKSFFLREWDRAQRGETTPHCVDQCQGCGLMDVCRSQDPDLRALP